MEKRVRDTKATEGATENEEKLSALVLCINSFYNVLYHKVV